MSKGIPLISKPHEKRVTVLADLLHGRLEVDAPELTKLQLAQVLLQAGLHAFNQYLLELSQMVPLPEKGNHAEKT